MGTLGDRRYLLWDTQMSDVELRERVVFSSNSMLMPLQRDPLIWFFDREQGGLHGKMKV